MCITFVTPSIPQPRVQDGEYSSADLRDVFQRHGDVEEVVMREGKKKKGSAIVVMASADGAASATDSVNGELTRPLLVIPLSKV